MQVFLRQEGPTACTVAGRWLLVSTPTTPPTLAAKKKKNQSYFMTVG